MKLIAYIRVSTDDQAENGHSLLLVQPQILAEWASREGHEIVSQIVDDGVSAGMPLFNRPGGKALLAALEAGEADGVICWRLDRLFRIGHDALTVGTWFLNRGLHIKSACEYVDIQTAEGWLTFGIMALNAEYERRKIVARAVEVSRSLRQRGRVYGPVPYGCVAVGDSLFREAVAWGIRERIVNLKTTGYSYRAIANQMVKDRIPAPNGGREWGVSTLKNIIDSHHELQHIPLLADDNEAGASVA